ncbi:conserved hypothetical protein [Ricinus communis]|uniref:Uncharacterized protein n=1 Tax=Ricinus communis TaxID=3988 RepID=B9SNL2_RICCO|nr:conserved hypothetical protein [Ricinus communis]
MVEQLKKNMVPQGTSQHCEALLTTRRAIGGSITVNVLRGSSIDLTNPVANPLLGFLLHSQAT